MDVYITSLRSKYLFVKFSDNVSPIFSTPFYYVTFVDKSHIRKFT